MVIRRELLILFAQFWQLCINYSQHIKSIWEHILNGDPETMSKVDYESVQALELACPKISDGDARMINRHAPIGRLLDEQQQDVIKGRLFKIDTLIPTFRSLFEDLNYLELLVNALQKLRRPSKWEHSLRSSLACVNPDAERAWESYSYTRCGITIESIPRPCAIPP